MLPASECSSRRYAAFTWSASGRTGRDDVDRPVGDGHQFGGVRPYEPRASERAALAHRLPDVAKEGFRHVGEDDGSRTSDPRQRLQPDQSIPGAYVEHGGALEWLGAGQHPVANPRQRVERHRPLALVAAVTTVEEPARPVIAVGHPDGRGEPGSTTEVLGR